MSKIVILNMVCGVLLLLTFGTGISSVMQEYQENGLVFERTITETVDLSSNVGGLVTALIMGFLFLLNAFILSSPMILLSNNYDTSGAIVFDGIEPEKWNIETDPSSNIFKVTLGEYSVSFSKDLLGDKE